MLVCLCLACGGSGSLAATLSAESVTIASVCRHDSCKRLSAAFFFFSGSALFLPLFPFLPDTLLFLWADRP